MSTAGNRMADVLERLEIAYDKVPLRREKIKAKLLEKEFIPLFERLCAAFTTASVDERIAAYLAFETRDNLLDALTIYCGETASNVPPLSRAGKHEQAVSQLKRAVAAQVIVDKRANDDLEERAFHILNDAAQEADFNLERYRRQLELTSSDFGKRALELHQRRKLVDAAKAVGIALQKDSASEPDPRFAELARILTGRPTKSAVAMLREPFQREKYVLEHTRQRAVRRKSKLLWGHDARFWSITAGGALGLCLLSLAVGYVLSSMTTPGSTIFMLIGLVVGVLAATGFVWYRLGKDG